MKRFFVCALASLVSLVAVAQQHPTRLEPTALNASNDNVTAKPVAGAAVDDSQAFVKVDKMPSFQDGDLFTFRNWVMMRLRYPKAAYENGVQGRVLLSFVIERDGSLSNIKVLQTPHPSLSDEAVRVVKSSPKWSPGKQGDKIVRVKYTLPVEFRLQN